MIRITNLKVNHVKEPLGYDMHMQTFSWEYADADPEDEILFIKVVISKDVLFQQVIAEREVETTKLSAFLELSLAPCTRYYWRVETNLGSSESFFETGKLEQTWNAKWIQLPDGDSNPVVRRMFEIGKKIERARAYVVGYGLYEFYLNGKLVNDGYLQPGFNNYNLWSQYQTFDITELLIQGENRIGVLLGEGWYKGRFGVAGGQVNNFGEHFQLLLEIQIDYADGSHQVISSDEKFEYTQGPIISSGIYDGEIYDANKLPKDFFIEICKGKIISGNKESDWKAAPVVRPKNIPRPGERYSIPVIKKEEIAVSKIRKDANDFPVLDFGQNITGWVVFYNRLPKGEKIVFRYAEHYENNKIYTKTLAGAKQEFVFVSDGIEGWIRPHFTYYGFQYVEVTGMPETMTKDDFAAWNIYSDMESIGQIFTGNPEVNQLVHNAMWSQRDNFLEHPTDCPQRGERLGWTGDAQIYCGTAAFNMDTSAFFRKYIRDVNAEQEKYNGMVPFIVPKIVGRGFDQNMEECSAAWSDVTTIMPWTTYLHSGDKNLLKEEYDGMKKWVDYIFSKDEASGNRRLWQSGFHFGDWLSLDGDIDPEHPEFPPLPKTDKFYIASSFYYFSTKITGMAAEELEYAEDAKLYLSRAEKIRQAILTEYFTDGVCKIDTQTAYAIAIYMEIVPAEYYAENGRRLVEVIKRKNGHLDTGFVGTPYLCPALTKAGYRKEAYDLLLQREHPGWLFSVTVGATTIWESWNVLNPDGSHSGAGSQNHYAFGAVVEWIYRYVCGMDLLREYPGFEKVLIAPVPDRRLKEAKASVHSGYGTYISGWKYDEDEVIISIDVPFMGNAEFIHPVSREKQLLKRGHYEFRYIDRD